MERPACVGVTSLMTDEADDPVTIPLLHVSGGNLSVTGARYKLFMMPSKRRRRAYGPASSHIHSASAADTRRAARRIALRPGDAGDSGREQTTPTPADNRSQPSVLFHLPERRVVVSVYISGDERASSLFQWLLDLFCCRSYCCDCCLEKNEDVFPQRRYKYTYVYAGRHRTYSETSSRASSTSESRRSSASSTLSSSLAASSADRRGNSSTAPVIDMRPIEFWPAGATNKESVQPRSRANRLMGTSGIVDVRKFQPRLVFIVTVREARNLPFPMIGDESRQDFAHSNPYVKVCLLPDQKSAKQSSVKPKTQNPEFNETFKFEIPFLEVQRRMLLLSLQDYDKFSRHCVIGQVILPLENYDLLKVSNVWKPLQPSSQLSPDRGDVLLSINYLPSAGRLNVDVIKANQLLQTDIIGGCDPFVRVQMVVGTRLIKSKKTSCKKNTIDPVFNESVSFNVTPDVLDDVSLVITVWDYNCKSRDDFVGRFVLGRHPTGAQETAHWERLQASHRSPVAQWHTLKSRSDCDQCSLASVAASTR
ncbi:Synaptotagmin-17 [Branchiostoma belcheri]|nr:Synaptotagmin-17 [Branchiostoma belcheri]